MDGTTFDQLITRLSTTSLTRATVLRGLATSGVAALAGVSRLAEPNGAVGRKKRRRNRKKPVCNCTSALASSCTTQKLGKQARKRLLASNACAYQGRCTGVSGCAAPLGCNPSNNTQGSCQPGQICNLQAICVAGCTTTTTGSQGSCPTGQICVVATGQTIGQCQTGPVCSPVCNPNQVCCPAGTANVGLCRGTLQAC